MSTQNLPYIVIVDTPSATAADTAAVVSGESLIKDGAGSQLYKFRANKVAGGEHELGLVESAKSITYGVGAVSAGLVTSLIISQDVDEPGGDGLAQVEVSIEATSTDTNATIATKLKDLINKHLLLKVTATSSTSNITLVGDAGYPVFTVLRTENLTAGTGMATRNATGDGAVANRRQQLTGLAANTDTVISPGDTVTLSDFAAGDGRYVVAAVASTTLTVFNETGTDIDATSGTRLITLDSQDRRFNANDLNTEGVVASFQVDGSGDPLKFTADAVYAEYRIPFMASKGYGGFNEQTSDQEHLLKVYIKQSGSTAANFAAALTGLDNVVSA